MIRHIVQISAATAVIVMCMLLPYLPGTFDGLAVGASGMAQAFAVFGLALVPLGAIWLWANTRAPHAEYWIALVSFCVATLIAIIFAVIALVQIGPSLMAIIAIAWAGVSVWLLPRMKSSAKVRQFGAMPYYLILLPLIAAIVRYAALDAVAVSSRNRVIEHAAALIRDIERYRAANGRYPPFLLSVHKDYHPGVMGVDRYHYAPHRDAYNLYFEHPSTRLGIREFVVYNPRDEHVMTSHALELLELSPEQLEVEWTRGHNIVHDAPYPHWKYFWFD